VSAFRFRLARLLRVREVEEELARERWRTAERIARAAEGRVDLRRGELARSLELLRTEQARERIDPARVLAADLAIEGQRAALQTALEHARSARLASEQARAAWLSAKRAHEGLTRLEARDRELARQTAGQKEARELDEVASVRAERSASRAPDPATARTPRFEA
jgi:flagellar biosynthesis chaperone FliJ